MKPTKKAWVQAAIDVTDLALAQKAARIAKEAGAEWIEVGTPLLFEYGHKSIDAIRSVVGELPLVADYKVPGNAVLVMEPARQHGAQFAIVMNAQDDYSAKEALELSRKTGVKVIFTMDVPGPQMAARAKQLEALGAEYIMVHHHYEEIQANPNRHSCDFVGEVADAVNIPVGVSSDNLDEALEAVRQGASWVTFGFVLRDPDPETAKMWIDAIHHAR